MDATSIVVGVGAAPIIATIISLVVKPLVASDRWYPLIAIGLGIAWNVGAVASGVVIDASYGVAVFVGITAGLTASGIYSSGKALMPPAR